MLKRNSKNQILSCGEITLDLLGKQVFINEQEITLTVKEYQLLEYLMLNQGQVLTKENILEQI